jgi:tetratricopeptide (TPR) repeat protein
VHQVAHNEDIGKVVELLNAAGSASSRAESAELLQQARETVADVMKTEASSADMNYLAGSVMYQSFCTDEQYGAKAEEYFLAAHRLDPDHQFARLYLGHYYYDTGLYQKALEYFVSVDRQYFISLEQQWRVLKLHELILCCRMFIGDPELTEADFEVLKKEYLSTPSEDVPVPGELVDAFRKTAGSSLSSGLNRSQIKQSLEDLIDGLDFSAEFKASLKADLSEAP